MARSRTLRVAFAAAAVAALASWGPAFLPGPGKKAAPHLRAPSAAASLLPGLLAAAPAAFADQIGDASAKFSDAAYPVAEKFNWANSPVFAKYLGEVSAKDPKAVSKAVERLLDAGLTMDPKLIQAAVKAHEKALASAAGSPTLVASKADFAAVNEALARMIASADPEKFFYLLSAFPGNNELQMELFKGNSEADARAAYEAFVGLTDAVRAASAATPHPAVSVAPVATSGPVAEAAKAVAESTYGIASKINWGNTPIISKYIQEASAKDPKLMAKALAKTLAVGSSFDMDTVRTAVATHAKALEGAQGNSNLMASKADWTAIMQSLAAMIKTSDPAAFKSILNLFPASAELQMALFAANSQPDAQAAYKTFVALTDAVKR